MPAGGWPAAAAGLRETWVGSDGAASVTGKEVAVGEHGEFSQGFSS